MYTRYKVITMKRGFRIQTNIINYSTDIWQEILMFLLVAQLCSNIVERVMNHLAK